MRKQTRLTLGVIGLSALSTSYLLGHQGTDQSLALSASAATSVPQVDATATQTDAQVTSPTTSGPTAAATPSETATSTSTATSSPSATTKASATPTPTATSRPSSTPTPTATSSVKDGTYTSDTISYRYGQVQLKITVASGALSDISLIKATTEGRGYDQAPPILVNAALQAGGTNFGNLSGATFVTQAFKKALDNALAKAGLN